MKSLALLVISCVLSTAALRAADPEPIPADEAVKWGARLAELAAKIEKPQVTIEPDASKTNGVHVPDKAGVMVVPQKNLQESEELAAKFKSESGAALAFLFTYHVRPVVGGEPVSEDKLHQLKVTDEEGKEHQICALLLAVRQLAEDDYRLYVYGKGSKPLVDAQFSADGAGAAPQPVAVEVKNPNQETGEGDIVITVFGQYQAKFRARHTP